MLDGSIRALSLCIIKRGDKILVMDGHDNKKNQDYYRLLGGGIEFGEYAKDALVREFKEELDAELINIKYITTLENIFTLNEGKGHEVVMIFEADFKDESLYEKESMKIMDTRDNHIATWEGIADFKTGKHILYPDNILQYI